MARHFTSEEIQERLGAIQEFGIDSAANAYGVTRQAMKSLVRRHTGNVRRRVQGPSTNGVTADSILDALLARAERLKVAEAELEGARAKVRQLEGLLESEKEARLRAEDGKQNLLNERLRKVIAEPGD